MKVTAGARNASPKAFIIGTIREDIHVMEILNVSYGPVKGLPFLGMAGHYTGVRIVDDCQMVVLSRLIFLVAVRR